MISVFYEHNSSVDTLYKVAEKIILHLYGHGDTDNLGIGDLRYNLFTASAAAFKKEVVLASLPPTESSLREHTKRVYYQIQIWLGNTLNAEEWGWRKTLFMMLPTMSTSDPAPQELIEKVFCGCKTNCTSARCSCKKSGLKCNQFCKSCYGQSCDNATITEIVLEDDNPINDNDDDEREYDCEEDDEEEEEGIRPGNCIL
ncbi:unnamed protein product [Euphydryas editha]|uniref:Tesmin/TSO1-like CXC domain-containing protein n=1 Tax=Euphydryas editha TaxID=104508 RepID=A0AAU9TIB3_EUPED|nr:unnamed protein product [Euphydryas editha]